MPNKKTFGLLLVVVMTLAACQRPPKTDFRILRFIDLMDTENIVSSPFASGTFDPGQAVYYHEKSSPLVDRGSGRNPLGLKRKLTFQGMELNTITAPPKSQFAFTVELPQNGILEFGAGVVRGAHSEEVRKKLAPKEDTVNFRIRLEAEGLDKTIFQDSINLPPLTDKTAAKTISARIPLPAAGGKTRISFMTNGPQGLFSFWVNPVVYSQGPRTRKIILISIDTLRADHLGCYGYPKDTSPKMDALAGDSVVFMNTYAPSPWTLPSHVSLLTSLSCLRHGVNLNTDHMDSSLPTLADELRTNGFLCAAFTGGGFLSPIYGFSKGFDLYAKGEGSLWENNSAGQVFQSASKWMDRNQDKDFFLFIHTYQAHNPYIPPPPYNSMFLDADRLWMMVDVGSYLGGRWGMFKNLSERERRNVVGLYDGEIRYTDEALVGALIMKLKEMKIYDQTMIILTSDHGEEFFDHRTWEHGRSLYDEVLRVPLIIKFPGSQFQGKKIFPRVRLLDIMPTIMDSFGVKDRELNLEGRSLVPVLKGKDKEDRKVLAYLAGGVLDFPVPEKAAIIEGRDKVIVNDPYEKTALEKFLYPPPPLAEVEVYDLAADPREQKNIVFSRAELARRLVAVMKDLRRTGRKSSGEKVEIEKDVEEKLRTLGYIE